ncbi:MAG: diguanylate cyclase [Chloroflexota bacterium]|nr:diguanylate cyclase [Chloroflexota bacterium]
MFQLTDHSIVQFTNLILYAILVPIIMCYGRSGLKRLFLFFLLTSLGCSLTSLLTNLQLPYGQSVVLKALVPLFSTWSVVAYAHFTAAFVQRNVKTVAKVGYVWLSFVLVLIIYDYYAHGAVQLSSQVIYRYGREILNSPFLAGLPILGMTAFLLIRSLKASSDPEERNRIAYLLAGLCFMVAVSILWAIMPDRNFTLYHISYMGNTFLVTYVLLKYRLLDIQLVIKKWLVYAALTLCMTIAYLGLLLGLSNLLRLLSPQLGIPATAAMVILLACSFNWLRSALDKSVDRLFYGNRYVHRQMLLSFASKMSKLIDMKEIADAMLPSLARAIRAKQVILLLAGDDYYTAKFMARLTREEPAIRVRLHLSSVLVRWLERAGKPLLRKDMEINPDLTGLSPEEKSAINTAQIELLCPILSKHKLVGILALGKKHPHGYYSRDDVDLVAMLSDEAAIAIENAQMYTLAKERANIDELTGLFNHRHFHERLDQEIARCSRFGNTFSLVFLDLDLFKKYNDVCGHLAGDELLKEIGLYIRDSIREVDAGFRYGGDEFAVIMPQTPIKGAHNVAERLRHRIAARVDLKGIPVTGSIGVAAWPTDGVMREEIIRAADVALYRAKETGKNRICWACEVALSEIMTTKAVPEAQNKTAILNTIYALAATVDAKDHYTYGHSKKVSKYAVDIAEALGYSPEMIENMRTAGLLHDIGKLGVADHLLSKRGPLSPEDWELIHAHPNLGVSILRHVDSLNDCLAAVQYHHECYNGSGYPAGLKGDNIPLDARILAVADSYDAMTSRRPYRDREMTAKEAIAELRRCAGKQFDPVVVEAFAKLYENAPREVVPNGVRAHAEAAGKHQE